MSPVNLATLASTLMGAACRRMYTNISGNKKDISHELLAGFNI
jgi:hypothetical protein